MNSTYLTRPSAVLLALLAATPLFSVDKVVNANANHDLSVDNLSLNRFLMATAGNWVGGVAPVNGDDVFLNDNPTGDRLVVVSQAAATPTSLNSINFTQTSAFINRLDVRTPLTVTNSITLSASGGGQSILRVDTANVNSNSGTVRLATYAAQTNASSTALTVDSITVGDGGTLVFARNLVSTTNTSPRYLSGSVTVDSGGTFTANRAIRPAATTGTNTNVATSQNYIIGGGFTLNAGGVMNLAPDNPSFVDNGSGAGSELTDTRLQINGNFTTTGGSIISGNTGIGDLNLAGSVNSIHSTTNLNTTDLTLTSLLADSNQSLTSGTELNGLGLVGNGNSVKTVTSSAEVGSITFRQNGTSGTLALELGANLVLKSGSTISASTLGAGTSQAFTIDTNGFALNGSGGAISLNNSSATRASDWTITGGGSVSAGNITFNATGNSTAPDLIVTAGTDVMASTFDATNAGALTLGVDGLTNFASIVASTQIFAGTLTINLGAAPSVGNYQLFGSNGGSGDFSSVSVTGMDSLSLAGTNIWTGVSSSFNYSFSELDGQFTISAIPEPSAFSVVAGLAVAALASTRRRRALRA